MKILLVVNVRSLEKRSNQPKYKEPRTRGREEDNWLAGL